MAAEHVVINDRGLVTCKHCGASYNHGGMLPAPLEFTTRVMELFLEMHEDCLPEENTDESGE